MEPAFHRSQIAGFGEIMTGRTLDMLAQWQQRADPGQPLDVAEELTGLTMAIIAETMFGARLDGDIHAVSQAIGLLLADINFRFQLPFYPSLRWPTLRNRLQRFAPDAAHQRPRFAYMPFGGGPHQCIGNSFALLEATLILATVAQRYRLRLPTGAAVTPQPKSTLRPAAGLPMVLDARN
jgi:cytochrome P450